MAYCESYRKGKSNDRFGFNVRWRVHRHVRRFVLDAVHLLKGKQPMAVSFETLSPSEQEFVFRVCDGLWNQFTADLQPLAVYGDGSASPNGEKFAAVLQGSQVLVAFDFNKGFVYKTAVQLPVKEN